MLVYHTKDGYAYHSNQCTKLIDVVKVGLMHQSLQNIEHLLNITIQTIASQSNAIFNVVEV